MASSPSAAFLRLRAYIAERMSMSPINQPLMFMELLGRRSPAPAHNMARRILGEDVTQIEYYTERVKRMVGLVQTDNGITAYGDGERDALLELCHHRTPISGSIKVRVHRCSRGRCAWCRGSREFVKIRPRRAESRG